MSMIRRWIHPLVLDAGKRTEPGDRSELLVGCPVEKVSPLCNVEELETRC